MASIDLKPARTSEFSTRRFRSFQPDILPGAVQELKDIAAKHHKTVAQVSLRWSLQQGFLPLPKSLSPERIRENADLFDFELTKEDMKKIAGLKGCCCLAGNPDKIPF